MHPLLQILFAFLFGGFLCLLAQLLIDKTKLTPARILVLYVSLGVLVYAVGAYDFLFDIFGAGVSVPLIGFGANIAKGVKEAVDDSGILGILTGGLTSSAGGITTALIFGLLASVLFKSKSKRM